MEKLKDIIVKIKEKVIQRSNSFENSNKEEKDSILSKLEKSIFSIDNLITLLFLIFVVGGIYLFNHIFLGASGDNQKTTDSGGAVVAVATENPTQTPIPPIADEENYNINKVVSNSYIRTPLRDSPIKSSHPKKGDFSIKEYLPELPDMPDMPNIPDVSNLITYNGSVETIKAVVDKKSYRQSDLLIIGDIKIWFGRDSIKINEDELCIKNKNKLICRLEGVDVSNIGIVRQLTKQRIGKIRIGRHKKETWIVITPDSSYSNSFGIREVSGKEYEEEIVFHKKHSTKHTTERKVSPTHTTHHTVNSNISKSKVKHWNDSDGLYLGGDFVATFKSDRVTLERGSCNIENGKWICTIPNKKVQWEDISPKIRHLNAIASVKLNLDSHTKRDARVIITLKDGYRAVKKIVNKKEVLVFEQ